MQNSVADILRKIGYGIIIIGFIGGIFAANDDVLKDLFDLSFIWPIAISTWIYAFIVGVFFIGIAEIIEILNSQSLANDQNKRLNQQILEELQKFNSLKESKQETSYKVEDKEPLVKKGNDSHIANSNKTGEERELKSDDDAHALKETINEELIDVSELEFFNIKKFYPGSGIVERITSTPFEGVYMVVTTTNRELIRYFGFMPNILIESNIRNINGLSEWYDSIENPEK